MNEIVIGHIDEIDVGWLNAVLHRARAVITGEVSNFTAEPLQSVNARHAAIRVEYEPGSTGTLPRCLLLKMCEGGPFGPSEVHYHARDYVDLADAPIPRCFDAAYSTATGQYHILMEDLSLSHRDGRQEAPTYAYGAAVAESLAVLHVHYSGEQRRGKVGATIPGSEEIDRYLEHVLPGIEPMIAAAAGEIDPSWPDLIRRLAACHPLLMLERTKDAQGFTLVHGDPNPGNILAPRSGCGRAYLVDRQPFDWSLTTWLGVADVAYVMVHWWDTSLRRQFEVPVLRRYHEALQARGVAEYSWDQLLWDYRLCAVQSLYVPAARCMDEEARTVLRWVWLPQMQKTMAALVDLRCADLCGAG